MNAGDTSASQLLSLGNPEIKAKVSSIKEKIHMLKRENAELKKMGQFLKVENSKLNDFIQKQGIDLQCLQKELEIEVAKYHMSKLSVSVAKVVSEDSRLQQEAERFIKNMEHNLKEIETN